MRKIWLKFVFISFIGFAIFQAIVRYGNSNIKALIGYMELKRPLLTLTPSRPDHILINLKSIKPKQ